MSEDNYDSGEYRYSAEDIRRYLSGEMPPAQMHVLEQASLADPMLADALEGMRETKPDISADLDLLRRRLAERSQRQTGILPAGRRALRIAAAVLLLAGLSGLGYFLVLKSAPPENIAVRTPESTPAGSAPAFGPVPPAPGGDSAVAADLRAKGQALQQQQEQRAVPAEPVAAAPGKTAESAKNKKPAPATRGFPEAATDRDAQGTARMTQTGKDRIAADKKMETGSGEDLNRDVDSDRNDAIARGAAAPAAKTAAEMSRAGMSRSGPAADAPTPSGGWTRYRHYLDANRLQSPIDTSLHGTETLSFTVDKTGRPAGLIVEKSISPAHDSLAVRIIREGPGWRPAKHSAQRATITIQY